MEFTILLNFKIMKNRIIYLFTSHAGRLFLTAMSFLLGAVLGTDGVYEMEYLVVFWDYIYSMSILSMILYSVYGLYRAIKNFW
jgi:hypothetical protein